MRRHSQSHQSSADFETNFWKWEIKKKKKKRTKKRWNQSKFLYISLNRSNSKINGRNESLWSSMSKFNVETANSFFFFSPESSSRENEWTNFLFQLSKTLINLISFGRRHDDIKKVKRLRKIICDTIKKGLDWFRSVNCTDSSYVLLM